jgi:tyrosyl-tRNA synthetase
LKQAEFIKSNGEGRRLINNGGAKLNDIAVVDPDRKILISDANSDGVIKLSSGKKRHALLKAN